MLSTLDTLYRPYTIAGRTLYTFAIATHTTLTSDQAKEHYKTAWLLTQLAFWLTVLAGVYTIEAGRKFRAYYEAEWSRDVNRLVDWIATYPDRCIDEGTTDSPAEVLEIATPAKIEASVDADDVIPEVIQSILDSDCKMTKKLRAIATHFDIKWRNARGEGKHLLNADIKTALSGHPAILAAL